MPVSDPDPNSTAIPTIRVAVVYADPVRQIVKYARVAAAATVEAAVLASNIRAVLPDGFTVQAMGIFGRRVDPGAALREGDRIELYRDLIADPKQARRRRAEKQKSALRKKP